MSRKWWVALILLAAVGSLAFWFYQQSIERNARAARHAYITRECSEFLSMDVTAPYPDEKLAAIMRAQDKCVRAQTGASFLDSSTNQTE